MGFKIVDLVGINFSDFKIVDLAGINFSDFKIVDLAGINSLRATDLYTDPNVGGSVCDRHIYRS